MVETRMRDVRLWQPQLETETRPDGAIIVRRLDPLGPYPKRLSDRLAHWARVAPDRVWMAERAGDDWRRVSYAEALARIRAIGQACLDLGLSVDRPLMILSENSIEHALMALGAQYVGVASAAISPAYALVSTDYAKLRDIVAQLTPGAVFAADADRFARAIAATLAPDIPVIAVSGRVAGHARLDFAALAATEPSPAVDAANAATGPDTIAKFLFTSGTTGSPKAVIQTQRMLCSNMEMVADCFAFMRDEPPVVVDWAPWNHTASGNKVFNLVIYNGGTFYIDAGKPSPTGIAETIRNLRAVSPSWYFNVPAGYDMLVAAMERDATLRARFFRDLKMMMYAGAGMGQHTWTRLQELAVETVGARILLGTGLGATETAPFALMNTEPQDGPGNCGIPAQGVTLKLVPMGDRLEARLKGPLITPGYWRNPTLTAEAFDAEGFYRLGDALKFAVPGDATRGLLFDGRIAENFKLRTGTWVAVGALRARLVDQMDGLVRDVAIAGENRQELGALLVPFTPRLRALIPDGAALDEAAVLAHPAVRAAIAARLRLHADRATGSATRVMRALILTEPLSLDRGEVTDKGSINQRAVLRNRAELVERLYSDDPAVIRPAPAEARA